MSIVNFYKIKEIEKKEGFKFEPIVRFFLDNLMTPNSKKIKQIFKITNEVDLHKFLKPYKEEFENH